MDFAILNGYQIKSKNYCPNPIVKYGIPNYADRITNPKCVGTPAYNRFWEEQIYYIVNGYDTGGIHIPGRYYKFVNFDVMRGVAGGNMRAELHDFQLDFAYLIDHVKRSDIRKNIFVPKARRKSLTTMSVCMGIDYGFRFSLNYRAGVVAGLEVHADVFLNEWSYLDSKVIHEFRIKSRKNDKETVAGWQVMVDGEATDQGTRNTIYKRTSFKESNVFKGLALNDIFCEESGENEKLLSVIADSRDCIMRGTQQYGTFFIFGTGGDMNRGSKGFKEIHYNLDTYNCLELVVPAKVFLFPFYSGAKDENGILVEDVPNIQHLPEHERIGWSDEQRAFEEIEKTKQKLLQAGNLKPYFDYCQNNPNTVEEIFRKFSGNNFDILRLNKQGHEILSNNKKYGKFRLFEDDKGVVNAEPAGEYVEEKDCVLILHEGHPVEGYRWLDVAGIDSYDQDKTSTSKSLGAMVVFRRMHNMTDRPTWCPVALIRTRPDQKETFYEQCRLLSKYYNLYRGVLVDIANGVIINHFIEKGAEQYLSYQIKKFESPNSESQNQYGIRLTGYTRPRMVSALQTLFYNHVHKIWFEKIIDEALDFDAVEVDSDNDTIDALGLALMKALDMDQVAEDEKQLLKSNPYAYPSFKEDMDGNLIDVTNPLEAAEVLTKDGKTEDYISKLNRQLEEFAEAQRDQENGAQDDIYGI